MVSRRTNFGEQSELAPGRGGKLQSAGGRHKVTFRHCHWYASPVHWDSRRMLLNFNLTRFTDVLIPPLDSGQCNILSDFWVSQKSRCKGSGLLLGL